MRALLVPVKAFTAAKLRLAGVLSPDQRAALSRLLAQGVLDAAGELARFVVCDDTEVAAWAESAGATVLWTPGLGLSGAVSAGVGEVARRGYRTAVVSHGDLAHPENLPRVGFDACVALVPDLRHDGTNVAIVPAESGFRFSYGAGSFERHRAEARRLHLPCLVVHDRRLAADVDLPEDLQTLRPGALSAAGAFS